MKVLLATQFSIVPYDGRYYTKSAFAEILRRYGAAFGPLTLCVPVKQTYSPLMEDVTQAVSEIVPISRNESILCRKRREITHAVKESDLVIVRCHAFIAFWASDLAHRFGKPVLAEAMSCPWDAMWNHGLMGKLIAPYMFLKMRQVMARADYALYVTQEFLQRRYPCKNLWIGASNVALPAPSEGILIQRLMHITAQDPTCVTLMTCAAVNVAHKGHRFVVRAIPRLNAMGIRVRYFCVGQGDPSALQSLAEECGVSEQVVFTGVLPHDEIFSMLDTCDIYVQPSLQEGLPRALIEAMSRGCPCIGARTAGIPELLPEECLVPKRSAEAIADTVSAMLRAGLAQYAEKNCQRALEYQSQILDARRSAFFDRIRQEVKGDSEGECP